MSYQLNRVHLLICVFAGLVVTGGFVWHIFFEMPRTLFTMAFWISAALVLFYFVGHIVRSYLLAHVFLPPEEEFNFEEDEEYQAFVASLEEQELEPVDVMTEEPAEFDAPLGDPLLDEFDEPMPVLNDTP